MNKFEKNTDPKKALGIGLFSPKHFDNFGELETWLLQNFTKILKINHLPDPELSDAQWKKLISYELKYLFFNNNPLSIREIENSFDKIKEFYRDLHEVRNMGKRYGF